ncbi:MAG: ImmA/IrrE family metallo-endopeptidase [Rhizobiaceae bacterium]|nr:ImmA/IrrE family metallo-endopeptidase [Rhizobiaceae bacterium]
MNSTNKGDVLENAFYSYLTDQQNRGELVFDTHPPQNCKIYKKKRYYCRERQGYVEFDVVIEVYGTRRTSPSIYVIFECKNHRARISESRVTDFLHKIGRLFPHNSKGILVVTSKLQAGAENIARNAGIGIVKYNEHGFEIVADRKENTPFDQRFVHSQIFQVDNNTKPLKFSGFHDGKYFASIADLINSLDGKIAETPKRERSSKRQSLPFLSFDQIKLTATQLLEQLGYTAGAVDVRKICQNLSIDLQFSDRKVIDAAGVAVLGSANFARKTIIVNPHSYEARERFTIAHEIGHFALGHGRYLRFETIAEEDLLVASEKPDDCDYGRLEYQANTFAAELLLPDQFFLHRTSQIRRDLEFKDRGHGYIFVDDEYWNYIPYNELISRLSTYFEASKQAIEYKLKRSNLVTDHRRKKGFS